MGPGQGGVCIGWAGSRGQGLWRGEAFLGQSVACGWWPAWKRQDLGKGWGLWRSMACVRGGICGEETWSVGVGPVGASPLERQFLVGRQA